jgi:hypothetical protein
MLSTVRSGCQGNACTAALRADLHFASVEYVREVLRVPAKALLLNF